MRLRSIVPWNEYARINAIHEDRASVTAMADVAYSVAEIEAIIAPSYYRRLMPDLLGGPDKNFEGFLEAHFDAVSSDIRCLPPVYRCQFRTIDVFKTAMFSHDEDGEFGVYETLRPNDRPYTATTLPQSQSPKLIDGANAIYLGSVGSGNYGHWLVDDITRALICESSLFIIPDFGEAINLIKAQSLNAIWPGSEIQFVSNDDIIRIDNVEYITPSSYHPSHKSPFLLRMLRKRLCESSLRRHRKLFVPRTAGVRQIENQDEVQDRLERDAFTTIDVSKMSFLDQVRLFSEAQTVIGAMGAGMTNTIFCADETRVGYLAPSGWWEPFFWDLAAVMRHRYGAIYGSSTEQTAPPHLRDFRVDMDDLDRLLEWCSKS